MTPHEHDEPPPFLGTWKRVYAAVLFDLFVLIVLGGLGTLAAIGLVRIISWVVG